MDGGHRGKKEEGDEWRRETREDRRRISSGAWRSVWGAGPEGEPDSPQLPLLRLRLAAAGDVPPRAASRIHWWLA
nr:unnamed protein product [Digitaria exilis]